MKQNENAPPQQASINPPQQNGVTLPNQTNIVPPLQAGISQAQQAGMAPPAMQAFDPLNQNAIKPQQTESTANQPPSIDSGKCRLVKNSRMKSSLAPSTLLFDIHYRFNQPRSLAAPSQYGLILTVNGATVHVKIQFPADNEGMIQGKVFLRGVQSLTAPPQAQLSNMNRSNELLSNVITLQQVN